MNEEIDIIELLQRVKEGKAPKEIEIEGRKYRCSIIDETYDYIRVGLDDGYFDLVDDYNIFELKDAKIKILDKPIIEEFEVTDTAPLPHQFRDKINEIIKWINEKN